MVRIFVSYARDDLAAAQALAATAERAGYEVWWDGHIRAGARFSREIDAALQSAHAVVVLWSSASVQSAWVQDEAAEGVERDCLVPATLDGCKPPLGFRQYQTIDVSGWRAREGAFDELIGAIRHKLGEAREPSRIMPEQRPRAAPSKPSICVLPFVNMSGDSQEYFSDGITEDVITDLSKVSLLAVTPRSTAFTFKGERTSSANVAAKLGVTHVVEGTIRKSASRLRVTAQLIDTASGTTVWAERYDRDLTDIFEIQDELSRAIVNALQVKLLPAEKAAVEERSTDSASAYDIYLNARRQWVRSRGGGVQRSQAVERLCSEATAVDPQYASAWALLALAQAELRLWGGQDVDPTPAAERAAALNPRLAEPYCVRACKFEEKDEELRARQAMEHALELDPESWAATTAAAELAYRCGDLAVAISHFEQSAALERGDHASPSMLVSCWNVTGDQNAARDAAQLAIMRAEVAVVSDPFDGSAFASAAQGFAAVGERERSRKWVRKALNIDPGNLSMRYRLASTLASMLDDGDAALDAIEPFAEAARLRPHLRLLERDDNLASIRKLPRFQKMLAQARGRVAALHKSDQLPRLSV